MRALLLVLLFTVFGPKACGQGTTPAPRQPILPPPPPPPPNPPPSFSRDVTQTTVAPVETSPTESQHPIQELIDEGGAEITLDIEFKSFDAEKESKFQIVMRDASNRYCQTKGNCEGAYKTVSKEDVIVYNKRSVQVQTASRAVTSRTAVSFYIKNPKAQTMLTMTSEQLKAMFVAERKNIEEDLGYRLDLGDLDGFVPFTNGLLLDSWLIALLCVIGLVILVGLFVIVIYFRNKKRDTKLTFEDLEMEPHYENPGKVLPLGSGVGAGFPKKAKVDATTNVYQSEILSETKSVFIKPSMVKARADTDTQIYAVVHKEKQEAKNEEEEATRKDEHRQESKDPQVSPNAIVVTADVSSSNDGSSQSSEEPDSPSPDDHVAPPDYEQVTKEETDVIERPGGGDVSTSAAPPVSTEDDSNSDNVPPPPEPKDPTASETSSRKDSTSSQSRKDSAASSAKGSSTAGKEAAEVVGELENLVADQSKEISEDQGLDNKGFETTVDEDGEPSTEL